MSKARSMLAAAVVMGALALPAATRAQDIGLPGPANQNMPLSSLEQLGPGSVQKTGKSATDAIRDAKRKYADADPRVRVQGLEDVRYVDSPDTNELLFQGLSDPDVRVRIKAIDVLGARGDNDAVPVMSQKLFLRETPPIEKLHLVAALGRIGDERGALPIIEYLKNTDDTASRGTAVFALGEIGDPVANDTLIQIDTNDSSPLVRKLAQEAIEKIGGELPNRHTEEIAAAKLKFQEPTDEKLAKMRAIDDENQSKQY
ncbi:MAG TPA: HEAT repeat domain-containing protein [Candidatus Binataceae bacterium]|nr:HEAT repeat domain-containing protein [Candidatus Binataceae bacterium]